MPLNFLEPLAGRVLVSEPGLKESFFHRSVILLAEHNPEGTLGFILNKRIDMNLSEVLEQDFTPEYPLYLGGPVGRDSLFYLHSFGSEVKGSRQIGPNLYWGGDFPDLCQAILQNGKNEHMVRFFVGYAGWESGQLNKEIQQNAWVVAPQVNQEILKKSTDALWEKTLRGMGSNLAMLSYFPDNPALN